MDSFLSSCRLGIVLDHPQFPIPQLVVALTPSYQETYRLQGLLHSTYHLEGQAYYHRRFPEQQYHPHVQHYHPQEQQHILQEQQFHLQGQHLVEQHLNRYPRIQAASAGQGPIPQNPPYATTADASVPISNHILGSDNISSNPITVSERDLYGSISRDMWLGAMR